MCVKYYRKFLQTIFLVGNSITPLLFWPWADVVYEIPKVWFIHRWIEILGILGLIFAFFSLKKERIDTFLVILVIVFFITSLVSSFFGVDFPKSLHGNYYREDGLINLAHLIILFFFITLFYQKEWFKLTLISVSTGSILVSIVTLIDAFRAFVLGDSYVNIWGKALGSVFGNSNFLAGYLLVTLPVIFFLFEKEKDIKIKFSLFLLFCLQILATFLTRSWSGLFGILVFFLILALTKKQKNILFITSVTVSLLALVLVFTLNYKSMQKPGIIIAEGRERIFTKAFLAFRQRPILGWGWANFDYAFESVDWPIKFQDDVYVDKAHSVFLEILVTTGLVGFLVYIAIIMKALKNIFANKDIRNPLFIVFILYLIHSQTNIISISEELLFWFILGISAKGWS